MSYKIRFGVYEIDNDAMELRKHGVPIRLQGQPFRVLAMLAERPGQIITRAQLQERIWGDTFVDFEQSLNKAINRVREALNDNASTPQYVETVPRRGYRFIAPVAAPPQTEAQDPIVSVSSDPAPALTQPLYHRSRSRIVVITSLTMMIVLAGIGITTVELRQPKKLAFEEPTHLNFSGWLLSGSNPSNYEMGVDPQASYHGSPSTYLKAKKPSMEGFVTLMQSFGADQYAGKRIRLSGFVKSEDVRDWAGLWMRVQSGPEIVSSIKMQDRPIKGTTTWQQYEVVFDVPRDATQLAFGILLSKSGTVWLNNVKFEDLGPTNPNLETGPIKGPPLLKYRFQFPESSSKYKASRKS
jgi:DNA-binding winged helix-turn-helix (wHTH) protein